MSMTLESVFFSYSQIEYILCHIIYSEHNACILVVFRVTLTHFNFNRMMVLLLLAMPIIFLFVQRFSHLLTVKYISFKHGRSEVFCPIKNRKFVLTLTHSSTQFWSFMGA